MRLAHKRNVQKKLQKRVKALTSNLVKSDQTAQPKVQATTTVDTTSRKVTPLSLTPKQQQVFDIVCQHIDGINPKSIGLEAGQEDSKAASWATGALKKLLEDDLVEIDDE